MHGGEVDEGYCIVDTDALEESMSSGSTSRKQRLVEEYFKELKRVTELHNGYSFQFPSKSQSIEKLVQLITKEPKIINLLNLTLFSNRTKNCCYFK